MAVTASGLVVNGIIHAKEGGTIGGFEIGASALKYNGLEFGDYSKNYGVYVGQSGIQLGNKFVVTNGGNVYANNMSLYGTLTVGDSQITADDLRRGAERANSGYSDWNSASNRVSSYGNSWDAGYSYGNKFNNATISQSGAVEDFWAGNLRANRVYANTYLYAAAFQYGRTVLSLKTKTISGVTINYLGY